MRDLELREAVHKKIIKNHDDGHTLVIDEFSIHLGASRADIAVINGLMHGYELKSAKDNLLRLPSQVKYYSSVMDKVTLVVDKSHLDEACKIIPEWWGIKVADVGPRGGISISHYRKEKLNKTIEPLMLAQLLWRDECLSILAEFDMLNGNKSKPRFELWGILSSNIPTDILRSRVKVALKERHNWR
ncbi:sce7726 family protein [Dickeya dadantii]|uniref:sce7726 family protein n=1 Tax=Dickeya dadantii TaxID=204038 RepID=UPI00057614D8|nr:sce7726 family protein [Dickeya dadantii]